MKKILFAMVACVVLFSCDKKEIQVDNLSFDVSVERETYKVGDSVVFHFSGESPDIITFYSGELLNDYSQIGIDQYIDSRISLQFSSSRYDGHDDPTLRDEDPVRLKYSTDFNGVYKEEDIKAATWTDITERFYIPPAKAGALDLRSSGVVDVSDLFDNSDQPVYFGFFYQAPNGKRRTSFRFQSFLVQSTLPEITDISTLLYNFVTSEFQLVLGSSFDNVALETNRPVINYNTSNQPTFILFRAPLGLVQNPDPREAYAVTRAVFRPEATNIGPARGLGIKSFTTPQMSSYTHVYSKPGTYLVTFVVQNTNIYDSKKEVKQIEIVVED